MSTVNSMDADVIGLFAGSIDREIQDIESWFRDRPADAPPPPDLAVPIGHLRRATAALRRIARETRNAR